LASTRKRGDSFLITAYMGYETREKKDGSGVEYVQRKKTTTFTPPDGVTPGKAEKLAKEHAIKREDKIRGYVALDENKTLEELAEWYYKTVAPNTLKPNILLSYKNDVYMHIIPVIGREKLKNITPQMLDSLFRELQKSGNKEISYKLIDTSIF